MFGSLNMTKYFTPAFITAEYNLCVSTKTAIYAKTTISAAVVAYNTFYKQVLLDFAADTNYLDVKYKTSVQQTAAKIHEKIKQVFYQNSVNTVMTDDERLLNFT